MLALRLIRGARPSLLLRRFLVAAACAGTGTLLLTTLGYAASHPSGQVPALARLSWCAAPLAATAWLAVCVARSDPAARAHQGMAAAGLGAVRVALLAATSTALTCAAGCLAAFVAFLALRGDLGVRLTGAGLAADQLGTGHPLPLAGSLTLLATVPAVAAAATMVSLRPGRNLPPEPAAATARQAPTVTHSGLPWGVALTAVGLAVETYGGRVGASRTSFFMPSHLSPNSPVVLAGWLVTAVGLVFLGPGLTQLCGRLLSAGRPGVLRLLAGRLLLEEYRGIGRPLGVACAVAAGACTAALLHHRTPTRPLGPITLLGVLLVVVCAAVGLLTATLEVRVARAQARATLRQMGVSTSLLHGTVALRVAVLLAALTPLTWSVARLASAPLAS